MAVDASDDTCHLGLDESALTFHTAFAFAVETQATIGYAIPSEGAAFFAGCPILPIVVYAHCLTVWVLNAALIGGTLARLSRANLRAVEVVFSDKACVQCIRGTFYLRFQVRGARAPARPASPADWLRSPPRAARTQPPLAF